MATLVTCRTWRHSKHYSTILNVFIMKHRVAAHLYSITHHYSTQTNTYPLCTYNFRHTSVLWPSMEEIIIISQLKQNYWKFQYMIIKITINIKYYIYYIIILYTGCPRRKVPDFGRVFLMLKYTDITQNTYIQSWTVTEIMAREVWNSDSCYSLIDYQINIENGRNMWFL